MSAPRNDPPFPWAGLVILAAAIFISTVSEFLPTGLLPEIAQSLQVSESQVGLLVTIFALTVVVSAAPLTALTRRYSRKYLVVLALLVFCAANVMAAFAASYELLALSRVIAGLAHGLFWAIAGAYAVHLVPPRQLARAVAVTNAGGTIAFVMGVPLGTALGHALGWRWGFGMVAITVGVLAVLVWRFLPAVDHRVKVVTGQIMLPLRKDSTLGTVFVVCVTTLVLMLGQHTLYTYIAPFFTDVTRFDASLVPTLLFVYGAAGAIGLVLAGVFGGRFPTASIFTSIGAAIASVAILATLPTVSWIALLALVLWGASFGAIPALLQTRLLHGASPRIRDVSAALLTTAFNIGIGGGAFVGGALLDASGLTALPPATIALFAVAGVVVLASVLRPRRGVPSTDGATRG